MMKVHLIWLFVAATFVVFNNNADADEHKNESAEYLVRGRVVVVDSNERIVCNWGHHRGWTRKRLLIRIEERLTNDTPVELCLDWLVVDCACNTPVALNKQLCFIVKLIEKRPPIAIADTIRILEGPPNVGEFRQGIARFRHVQIDPCFEHFLHESEYFYWELLETIECEE